MQTVSASRSHFPVTISHSSAGNPDVYAHVPVICAGVRFTVINKTLLLDDDGLIDVIFEVCFNNAIALRFDLNSSLFQYVLNASVTYKWVFKKNENQQAKIFKTSQLQTHLRLVAKRLIKKLRFELRCKCTKAS